MKYLLLTIVWGLILLGLVGCQVAQFAERAEQHRSDVVALNAGDAAPDADRRIDLLLARHEPQMHRETRLCLVYEPTWMEQVASMVP